jgi:light-regulated signal transduction histidine kinase (bacteriophytochrome)
VGSPEVTLANCADEPIHLPGTIQPHGALLVFGADARLEAWSANAAEVLQVEPALASQLTSLGLPAPVVQLVEECIAETSGGSAAPMAIETQFGASQFDCITHAHEGRVIVEFEKRDLASDAVAAFALKAHGALDRLKRQRSIESLLQMAADQVRAITGFDRVMCYRFRQDESGDVVAEACRDDMDPYLGRRYPASDIPAQARRLYILNTLRLISDARYAPVPVNGRAGDAPLDMSHCVLRSVSPIHLEYLRNMGVAASMSVSIVVNGRLWGLIACHHLSPRQVPYSIRMATDVIAQVLASAVQTLEMREHSALLERSAEMRTRLMETLLHGDDPLQALAAHAAAICETLDAPALILVQGGRHVVHGEIDAATVAAVIAARPASADALVEREAVDDWPEPARAAVAHWPGMLALCFDPAGDGWLIALRPEQVSSVRWAGKPEKFVQHGPLGPRLTPRGSFDEWRETVRGRAEAWGPTQLLIARHLLDEMNRASIARHGETERARAHLLAMLGHDLRDPLNAIHMAATVLQHGGQADSISRRIQSSSGRMGRLISQVMDMSRISGGMGLGIVRAPVDFGAVVAEAVDEALAGNPDGDYHVSVRRDVFVDADSDRLAQVIGNLLGNARSHGQPGRPIVVSLTKEGGDAVFAVANAAAPIDEATLATLYSPFKHASLDKPRNRGGMGLGMHIVERIVAEHGGRIDYAYIDEQVVFTVAIPLIPALP